MKRYLPLIGWVLLIIYPSTTFLKKARSGSLVNLAYRSEGAHIAVHLLMFFVLALLVVYSFQLQGTRREIGFALLFILGVGVVQEGLQFLVSADRLIGWPELFDLGVDLIGGALGFAFRFSQSLGAGAHKL